ncbi:hypothetical protein GCM10022406_20030 [Hymenobacter algoricola]|uniref:ScoMcrA-like DNA sulfur-binding domain-containing protein n=2 Tax=Hymenobacter algoricola TaxID=486267 RepID=A0ABP7N323_9BACT
MLLNYVEVFRSLNVNATAKLGPKPYKPALLLAVIAEIEAGRIRNNQIIITPELIASFREYRQKLGATSGFQVRNFIYPFFHLRGEGFWRLQEKPGMKLPETSASYVGGLKQLQDTVAYARLDLNLWHLLQQEKTRIILRNELLAKYG